MPAMLLDHPATRAARDIEALIDKADLRLARNAVQTDYKSLHDALQASQDMLQFRRTFIQGCACSTGTSGGGCCPGNALAAPGSIHGASDAATCVMGVMGLIAGPAGSVSGGFVWRNTNDALTNLRNAEREFTRRANLLRLQIALLMPYAAVFPHALKAAQHRLAAVEAELRDVRRAIREQQFNRAVPGALQMAAGTVVTLGGINAVTMGCMGATGGCIIGALGAGLFALMGGLMAGKNALAWWHDRRTQPLDDTAHLPEAYRTAANAHLEARRTSNKRTALAWAGVGAAGALGALVASGVITFPGASAVVAGAALLAAGWAMWQNSRTRYVLHLPLSRHAAPEDLVSETQRAKRWSALSEQDATLKDAVSRLLALQPRGTQLAYDVERLFKPQCGPSAFQVLANRVQGATEALQPTYETILLDALAAYGAQELEHLRTRQKGESDELTYRSIELNNLVNPSCCDKMTKDAHEALKPGAPTEPVYTEAVYDAQQHARTLEHDGLKLSAWRLLLSELETLRDHAGPLSARDAQQPLTDAQETWVYARLNALQLSGTLGDAVTQAFMQEHPEFFSRNDAAEALSINNLLVLPTQRRAFARAIAPRLDGAFVHAFFNPRRIEAEMDFILDRGWAARAESLGLADAPIAAPACDSGTCCR